MAADPGGPLRRLRSCGSRSSRSRSCSACCSPPASRPPRSCRR
jgi:hypothetical protein